MFGDRSRRIDTSCLYQIGAHVAAARTIPGSRRLPGLLPTETPLMLLDTEGRAVSSADLSMPDDDVLLVLHRQMVLARRFDTQATALTKQGRLAVYP